jgi:lysozyme family protein
MGALFDTPRKRPPKLSSPPPVTPTPDEARADRTRGLSSILVQAEPSPSAATIDSSGAAGSNEASPSVTLSEQERRSMIDRMIERSEGRGFVNNPGDPGGPTYSGISQNYGLPEWNRTHPDQRMEDVRELERKPERVYEIYDALYLRKPKIDQIADPLLRESTFDAAVNQGTLGAVEMLQRAMRDAGLEVEVDGFLGPKTLGRLNAMTDRNGNVADAASAAKLKEIAHHLVERRRERYDDRIAKDPGKATFRPGWYKRAESFRPKGYYHWLGRIDPLLARPRSVNDLYWISFPGGPDHFSDLGAICPLIKTYI